MAAPAEADVGATRMLGPEGATEYALTPSSAQLLVEDDDLPQEEAQETPRSGGSRGRSRSPRRVVTPCYRDADLSSWTTRFKGKNKHGSANVNVFSPTGPPKVALFHADDPRCEIPFKVDVEPGEGRPVPSFLSGAPPDPTRSEGLELVITVTEEQAAFLERVDDWALREAEAHSKEWFGKQLTRAELQPLYSTCVRRDPENRYAPKFRSKMTLSGKGDFLTKVVFMHADGRQSKGAGWSFVRPLLLDSGDLWRGYGARAVLEVRSVWTVGRKFGLRTTFSNLLVKEKERGATDVDFPELA